MSLFKYGNLYTSPYRISWAINRELDSLVYICTLVFFTLFHVLDSVHVLAFNVCISRCSIRNICWSLTSGDCIIYWWFWADMQMRSWCWLSIWTNFKALARNGCLCFDIVAWHAIIIAPLSISSVDHRISSIECLQCISKNGSQDVENKCTFLKKKKTRKRIDVFNKFVCKREFYARQTL